MQCIGIYSKYFGVPQQRRRLYIVGFLDERCAGKIFPLENGNAETLRQVIGGSQGQRVYGANGVACTQTAGAGGWGGKTGLYLVGFNRKEGIVGKIDNAYTLNASDYRGLNRNQNQTAIIVPDTNKHFIDMNPDPVVTEQARCITTHQDSGIGKRRGERSGVLLEEAPRAILTPHKEKVRQQGRRIKEPDEEMFTITAQDRHGIWHKGRVRRLMPIECWRLQGFTDEQFYMAQSAGLADGQLYKMAGNAVSVPVITAIGQRIKACAGEVGIPVRKTTETN